MPTVGNLSVTSRSLVGCLRSLMGCLRPLVGYLQPLIGGGIQDKQGLHGLQIHGLQMHGSVLSEMFSSHCWVTSTLNDDNDEDLAACTNDNDDNNIQVKAIAMRMAHGTAIFQQEEHGLCNFCQCFCKFLLCFAGFIDENGPINLLLHFIPSFEMQCI